MILQDLGYLCCGVLIWISGCMFFILFNRGAHKNDPPDKSTSTRKYEYDEIKTLTTGSIYEGNDKE